MTRVAVLAVPANKTEQKQKHGDALNRSRRCRRFLFLCPLYFDRSHSSQPRLSFVRFRFDGGLTWVHKLIVAELPVFFLFPFRINWNFTGENDHVTPTNHSPHSASILCRFFHAPTPPNFCLQRQTNGWSITFFSSTCVFSTCDRGWRVLSGGSRPGHLYLEWWCIDFCPHGNPKWATLQCGQNGSRCSIFYRRQPALAIFPTFAHRFNCKIPSSFRVICYLLHSNVSTHVNILGRTYLIENWCLDTARFISPDELPIRRSWTALWKSNLVKELICRYVTQVTR